MSGKSDVPNSLPTWQLPAGVPKGVWEYAQAPHIAEEYDGTILGNDLTVFDQQVIARHCRRPGVVVDLGCGTGRALIPLVKRGFIGIGVDLSRPMLLRLREKAKQEGCAIWEIQANIVELGCLKDSIADYCLCLFSTLGMVRGRQSRRQLLGHVARILKPGGKFIVHVHNVWFHALTPAGRDWLIPHFVQARILRRAEFGDKFFEYHGIPNVFVHAFTRREFVRDLRSVGLMIEELIPLAVGRREPLPLPWFFGWIRANGWIAVCRRPHFE
ncbi:class I SAM-dependent methyltransferase [Thermogutta sp.]|uniref:class I SAM-dependent methyltransferase n=1 Tax=Thermogutta sp. TaxID=1962930 RepID=UPI003220347C